MKLKIYFFTLFIFFLLTKSNAQKGNLEYGISLIPSLVNNQNFDRSPAANYSAGLFANYNVTNRIGIAGGIEYQQMNLNTTICVVSPIAIINLPSLTPFCDHIPSVDAFQFTRIPLWISINLNDNLDAKSQFFLIMGYAMGKINEANDIEELYNLPGLISTTHFGKIGLEIKRKVNERMQLTGGLHWDMTNIYDDKYGDINMFGLVLRFGYI